ncbi:MAG: TRAP transporter large permease subunit [Marinilabiliales bacterium]|nr:TRAP transporter large permease subunit [Marinilabiliales bacterium]
MLIGSIAYFLAKGLSLSSMINAMGYGLTNAYILIAIPLFVFTANDVNLGKITDKVFDFASVIIGRKHGATGHVNILASLIFAAMTGSGGRRVRSRRAGDLADEEGRVRHAPSCAITAASAVIGPIFPPSIPRSSSTP